MNLLPSKMHALRQTAEAASIPCKTANSNKTSNATTLASLSTMVLRAGATHQDARMQTLLAAQHELQQTYAKTTWVFPSPQTKLTQATHKLADVIHATGNFSDFLDTIDAINLAAALPQASAELLTQRTWRRSVATLLQADESWLRQRATALQPQISAFGAAPTTDWQRLHRAITQSTPATTTGFSLLHLDVPTFAVFNRLVPQIVQEHLRNALEHAMFTERMRIILPRSAVELATLSSELVQLAGNVRMVFLGAMLSDHAFIAASTQPLLKINSIQNFHEQVTQTLLNYIAPKTYRWWTMALCGSAALGCVVNLYATSNRLALEGHRIKDEYAYLHNQINLNALQAVVETTKAG